MNSTHKCAACDMPFTGPAEVIRGPMWAHHDTHKESDFPPAKDGGHVAFYGDFVLSCNCGECDFCLEKAAKIH